MICFTPCQYSQDTAESSSPYELLLTAIETRSSLISSCLCSYAKSQTNCEPLALLVWCAVVFVQDLPPQQILLGLMCGNLHLDIPEWCEPEWRFLLEACMEPNPNNRPTMRELARQLEAIRDQQLQHEQELEELETQQQQAQVQVEQQEPQQASGPERPMEPVVQQAAAPAAGPQGPVVQQVVPVLPVASGPAVLLQQLQQNHGVQQLQKNLNQQLPPMRAPQQALEQVVPHVEQQVPVPQQQPVLPPVQLPSDLLESLGEAAGQGGIYGAVCDHYWPQQSPLAPAAVASPGHIGHIGPPQSQLQHL